MQRSKLVLVIFGISSIILLAGLAYFIGEYEKPVTRKDGALYMMSSLSELLEIHILENGAYPTVEQGLNSLVQLKQTKYKNIKILLNDPWGEKFHYDTFSDAGRNCYFIWSKHLGKSEGITNCRK